MKRTIAQCTFETLQGDITLETVDAIVNAANSTLLGGGGVDGAIHRAGGPAILAACRELGGCETGDAKITTAGNLSARHVIHAVGPVYAGGKSGEPELLASAYRRSLEVALVNGCTSISFPAISCGVYGYPHDEAAHIAVATIAAFLRENAGMENVRLVLFGETILERFNEAIEGLK